MLEDRTSTSRSSETDVKIVFTPRGAKAGCHMAHRFLRRHDSLALILILFVVAGRCAGAVRSMWVLANLPNMAFGLVPTA